VFYDQITQDNPAIRKLDAKDFKRRRSFFHRIFGCQNAEGNEIGFREHSNKKGNAVLSDQVIINVASNAIFETLKEAWELRKWIQSTHRVKNKELLSCKLTLNQAIPGKLKDEVEALRYKVQAVIKAVALEIEKEGYETIEESLKSRKLVGDVKERANKIAEGQFDLQVSYNSISIALRLLCNINKELLVEIEGLSGKDKKQTELLLMNSILVIEIVDAIINFLETFKLQGLDKIGSVCNEIMSDLNENEKNDQEFKMKLNDELEVDAHLKVRSLEDIELRDKYRRILRTRWEHFLRSARKAEDNVALFKAKINDLVILRTNAENQLGLLQIVAITGAMEENVRAVQGLLDIKEIELKRLTPTVLYDLLGIDALDNRITNSSTRQSDG